MAHLLEDLAQRAIQQRLEEDGGDWSAQMASEPAHWLRWAIMRDAATILSALRIPRFEAFQQQMRARTGAIPDVSFTPAEFYFVKLATVLASHHLLRMPEYGVNWNSVQAQRMEIRQRVEALDQSGRHDQAHALRAQMPKALRREDALKERKALEDVSAPSVMATTGTPASEDLVTGRNVRP